ncbi:MAG: hypothetical protein V2J25_06610 [Desulfatiglans sp.]|nr:hypothetical protein [Thermodesulfobacteriota bacterium]MEE4352527.1 hypothetical protein [Desulfatiglans sp.]
MKARRDTAVLFLFVAGLLFFVSEGCSKRDETEDMAQDETKVEAVSPGEAEYEEDTDYGAGDEGDIIDKGDPCRYHLYSLPPGFSGILTFEVELKKKIDREADLDTLSIRDNTWDKYGIIASVMSSEKETITVSYRIWTLDASKYYNDSLERGEKPVSLTIDDVTIKWKDDGYGIISQIKGYGGVEKIGRFSEEELTERLGGNLEVAFKDPKSGEEYIWTIEPGTEEREVMILSFDLSITLPEEGMRIDNEAINVWAKQTGWSLSVRCFVKEGPFTIAGPALRPECLDLG